MPKICTVENLMQKLFWFLVRICDETTWNLRASLQMSQMRPFPYLWIITLKVSILRNLMLKKIWFHKFWCAECKTAIRSFIRWLEIYWRTFKVKWDQIISLPKISIQRNFMLQPMWFERFECAEKESVIASFIRLPEIYIRIFKIKAEQPITLSLDGNYLKFPFLEILCWNQRGSTNLNMLKMNLQLDPLYVFLKSIYEFLK